MGRCLAFRESQAGAVAVWTVLKTTAWARHLGRGQVEKRLSVKLGASGFAGLEEGPGFGRCCWEMEQGGLTSLNGIWHCKAAGWLWELAFGDSVWARHPSAGGQPSENGRGPGGRAWPCRWLYGGQSSHIHNPRRSRLSVASACNLESCLCVVQNALLPL